jgi:hypothetical protein
MNFNSLFLILFFLPSICYSQQWEIKEMGNAFDGFGKMCYVKNLESDEIESALAIINYADTLFLHDGYGSDGMNNLSIKLHFTPNIKVKNIKMSFDKERNYFNISRFFQDSEKKSISLIYGFANNYRDGLNKIDICYLLKSKNFVHFRVETISKNYDFTFPLNASSIAINSTFIVPNYKKKNGLEHYSLELLEFGKVMSSINEGEYNLSFAGSNCINYLQKNIGEYSFIDVENIVTTDSKKHITGLIFKKSSGDILVKIQDSVIFKNLLFFSGNIKIRKNNVYKKDIATLEMYYDYFVEAGIIKNNNISIEEFKNLNKDKLVLLYKSILENPDLLDFLRIQESIFCFYEVEEYTLEVFIEPWGL